MDLLLRDVGRSTVLRDGSLPELAFAAVASERLHWAAPYLEDALKSSGALSKTTKLHKYLGNWQRLLVCVADFPSLPPALNSQLILTVSGKIRLKSMSSASGLFIRAHPLQERAAD